MSRRNCHPPHHASPHELRLWAVVDSLVRDGSEKAAYVAFARELTAAVRQPPRTPRSPSAFPGYSQRTKRVVQKWFERGLSGHLMWLIGEAILRGS